MQYQSLSIKNLQVAAFDWDNTLALTREALVKAINQVLHTRKMPEWEIVKQKRDPNLSFQDNFPVIFGAEAAQMYAEYREVYLHIAPQMVKIPDGAMDTLQMLQNYGVKIIIVSNKQRDLLLKEKDYLYPQINFDRIVCGHEAPQDKPHAEQLLYAVEDLVEKVNNRNVWLVGDSPMDCKCALSANARAILIGKPIWNEQITEKSEVVDCFANFREFFNVLKASNDGK